MTTKTFYSNNIPSRNQVRMFYCVVWYVLYIQQANWSCVYVRAGSLYIVRSNQIVRHFCVCLCLCLCMCSCRNGIDGWSVGLPNKVDGIGTKSHDINHKSDSWRPDSWIKTKHFSILVSLRALFMCPYNIPIVIASGLWCIKMRIVPQGPHLVETDQISPQNKHLHDRFYWQNGDSKHQFIELCGAHSLLTISISVH